MGMHARMRRSKPHPKEPCDWISWLQGRCAYGWLQSFISPFIHYSLAARGKAMSIVANNSFKPSPLRGLGATRFASGGPS